MELLPGPVSAAFDLILDDASDVEFVALESSTSDAEQSQASSASCDELLSVLSDAEHSALAVQPATISTAEKRRKRLSQTQRAKIEQEHLRRQITDLETRLAALMIKRALAESRSPQTAWRAVAQRQRARRNKAEQQNDILRNRLIRQLQVAKSLEAVFTQRAETFFDQLSPRPCPAQWPLDSSSRDLERVFEQIVADIHQAYDAVDTVFPPPSADTLLPIGERPPSRTSMKSHLRSGTEQLYVETRHAYVSPFPLSSIAQAIWPAVTAEYGRQQRELEKYEVNEHVYAAKVKIIKDEWLALPGVDNSQIIMMKLFMESSRLVLITRGFKTAECGTSSEAVALGLTWMMFRCHPSLEGHVTVHICNRVVPTRCPLTASRAPVVLPPVGAIAAQMMCTSGDDIAFLTDAIESLALDTVYGM